MKIIQNISVTEDVTMVTLETNPTDFAFTASIFERIAEEKINVDNDRAGGAPWREIRVVLYRVRRGFGPAFNAHFPVSHPDARYKARGQQLEREDFRLRRGHAHRIGCGGEGVPGAAGVGADIRLITTSEADISLLITKADYQQIVAAIEKIFE